MRSWVIYAGLIASLVVCRLLLATTALDFKTEGQRTIFSWWVLAAISVYGALGVYLMQRASFPDMWNRRGQLIAAAHGAVIGLATIALDIIKPMAPIHHPLPEALPFYWYGAVISEIWFHLLPVPLLILVLGRNKERAFWIALIVLSNWENRRFFTTPEMWTALDLARHLVTFAANASEIWLYRRYGFLAAISQRLVSYSLWHIAWPALDA